MSGRTLLRVLLGTILMWFGSARAGDSGELQVGDPAPPFELSDQNGETRRLGDYLGRWVVLYFYPKDDTPGCTAEACGLRDVYGMLEDMGAAVLGVSLDDTESHKAFASKFRLPFPLLADTGGRVAKSYGALNSLGFVKFARRHSFIIDPQGRIAKVYRRVDAKTHADEVIADLKALGL